MSALCFVVIDLICVAVAESVIIGLILGLMEGTNDTADTDMYCLVDTINVKYPYLSSLKLEWIEAALVFSIILPKYVRLLEYR